MTSEIKVDTISEQTSANGVTIDGLTIKDGNIQGSPALVGTTPSFTIGDGGAEDTKIVFDGNALDYYIGLDDSADNLIIGSGSTVGSNSLITIDSDGDLSLDIAGDILLDAGGADIRMISGGTDYCKFTKDGNNTAIKSQVSDGDLILRGSDSGVQIDALTFDMSAAGAATFNSSVAMTSFTATVGSTITTADNTDTLTLTSTDADPNQGPNLRLYRNNDSNANDDILGQISFDGRNNNSQDVEYAFIRSFAGAITDGSENGVLDFRTIVGGTERNRISMDPSSTTINEEGIDLDFRVESNNNANCLIVKGANDRVGIGGADASFGVLGVENAGDSHIDMFSNVGSGTIGKCEIFFSTDSSANHVSIASIVAQQPTGDQASRKGEFRFNVSDNGGPAVAMLIGNNGNIGIGTDGPQARLDCQTPAASTPALEAHATSTSY